MVQVCQYTASGEAHGLVNTLTNSVPFDDFKHFTDLKAKAKMEKEKKEDARIVKVEYIARNSNERLDKPYCKYAGEPILVYHLIPGYVYELPFGMVKEVNETEKRKQKRSGLVSLDGNNINADGSPLSQDMPADWTHRLVGALV